MVKRVGVLCALGVSAVAFALAPAVSSAAGEAGPRCADITGGAFVFDAGMVSGSALLAAPACKQVTYTLYVLDRPGGTLLASSSTPTVLPNGNVKWDVAATDTDGIVCVYAETTSNGGKVFDRAPDTGCVEVSSSSGGVGGFN